VLPLDGKVVLPPNGTVVLVGGVVVLDGLVGGVTDGDVVVVQPWFCCHAWLCSSHSLSFAPDVDFGTDADFAAGVDAGHP
jgi:hypothetical protein